MVSSSSCKLVEAAEPDCCRRLRAWTKEGVTAATAAQSSAYALA
jgi:hypothetical protein